MLEKIAAPILFVGAATLSIYSFAQAPVEDRSGPTGARGAPASGNQQAVLTSDATTQIYLQLQTLRQEVTELRGLVEELTYQLEQLGSRQATDYANLDRRILELGSSGARPPGTPVQTPQTQQGTGNQQPQTPAGGQQGGNATAMYNQAFASLRNGDRNQAIQGFNALIEQYPRDPVAADALYWLGETHWVSASYEDARQAFVRLTEQFQGHRRYADAHYRLGLIYHQLGNAGQARQHLQAAVQQGGDVGARAQEYLSQNLAQ